MSIKMGKNKIKNYFLPSLLFFGTGCLILNHKRGAGRFVGREGIFFLHVVKNWHVMFRNDNIFKTTYTCRKNRVICTGAANLTMSVKRDMAPTRLCATRATFRPSCDNVRRVEFLGRTAGICVVAENNAACADLFAR